MATSPTSAPPGLGLRQFGIRNFRTFNERQVINLEDGVTVFHGITGSGKSTALAAMDIYFRALANLLERGGDITSRWNDHAQSFARSELLITERDRPVADAPTVFEAIFPHDPSTWVNVRFTPTGPHVTSKLEWNLASHVGARQQLLQLLFPFGSNSRPLAVLDARRRPRWVSPSQSGSLLAPSLAEELYALRTSKLAADKSRWRSFVDVLTSFPTLRSAEVSIEAGVDGRAPELVIEHPGRMVLGLDELSSGEQELAALTAGLLLSKAAIVAIEEPEVGLDVGTQELWKAVCEKQRASGFVHQIIFESHAVTFDGARVVRFHRDTETQAPWAYTVVDPPALAKASDELASKAKEKGATEVFVTSDGYTRLPESMRSELGLGEKGAHVWFLPGRDTWEAWPEQKLEDLLQERSK
jgi:hypothetical protein